LRTFERDIRPEKLMEIAGDPASVAQLELTRSEAGWSKPACARSRGELNAIPTGSRGTDSPRQRKSRLTDDDRSGTLYVFNYVLSRDLSIYLATYERGKPIMDREDYSESDIAGKKTASEH